ncbi:CGNR zinc finger domain-containing protein [Paenibacillus sp. WLX1005]|uniref:CGNR zinc finger domain-containing protein n=1 Tax=Paenibacillus sp. WLX1005 TaxID=3243766 RepID=UPI0039843459
MDMMWTDFLNSDYHDWKEGKHDEDKLPLPTWQQRFLEQHQLKADVPANEQQLAMLCTLRAQLSKTAAEVATGESLSAKHMQYLNDMLAGVSLQRQLQMDKEQLTLHYVCQQTGWDMVAAEIVADFAATLLHGDARRIRHCDNPDCRWVFYDDTRSRTKRYCDDKLCGNLMKVRRFRARQKNKKS